MKKLSLLVLITMLVVGWSQWGAGERASAPYKDIELLDLALTVAKAEPEGGKLLGRAKISGTNYSVLQGEAAVETIAEALGLHRHEYEISTRSTGKYCWATMESDDGEGVLIELVIHSTAEETVAEVSIDLEEQKNTAMYCAALKTAFLTAGAEEAEIKITTCLEGSLNAKLRQSDSLDIVYKVFDANAVVYRGALENKRECQWYGWSALFAGAENVAGKQVNFGISLSWNAAGDRTYIRVATPVLP